MSSQPLTNEEILALSYNELQAECRKAKLLAIGKTNILRERLREHWGLQTEEERPAKKPKTSVADHLICPITLKLPWEPVAAEDGSVYEKSAIEQHIQSRAASGSLLTSPMTSLPMGSKLIPLPQHKSHIETLIEMGAITGDLASQWNAKVEEKKAREELIKKAESGDASAQFILGEKYYFGKSGLPRNHKLAYEWHEKAHASGHVAATASLGEMCLHGIGVAKSYPLGIFYSSMAATQGSNAGAYYLGMGFARGRFGLPEDKKEAIRWLQKAVSCSLPHQHMTRSAKEKAKEQLKELTENI